MTSTNLPLADDAGWSALPARARQETGRKYENVINRATECLACGAAIHDVGLGVYVWADGEHDELRGYIHEACWERFMQYTTPGLGPLGAAPAVA